VCPLCGRFVSLRIFDPSRFESDIYAVDVRGLGRGKGFTVSEVFSVVGEPAITGPIAERCRKILGLIEGKKIISGDEASVLRAEVERWKGEVLREQKAKEELFAKLAELEGQAMSWRDEALRLRRLREEHAAELAGIEDEARKWRNLVERLRAEVARLASEPDELDDDDEEYDEDDEDDDFDDDDEEEMLAVEEMQEILDRINASANASFKYLSDAVDFLLEGG